MVPLFLQWLYVDAPVYYVARGFALLNAFYNYFSIPFLLETLFAPWRHDAVALSRLPLNQWGQALLNNAVSRFMGFILRSSVIVVGGLFLALVAVVLVCFILAWYGLPVLMLLSLLAGVQLLVGGFYG